MELTDDADIDTDSSQLSSFAAQPTSQSVLSASTSLVVLEDLEVLGFVTEDDTNVSEPVSLQTNLVPSVVPDYELLSAASVDDPARWFCLKHKFWLRLISTCCLLVSLHWRCS
jgi:hypothetical protein